MEPALQGRGVGGALMAHIESRAIELGATELALDTSELAVELIGYYARRGYSQVDTVDRRPKVNYRSVILARSL